MRFLLHHQEYQIRIDSISAAILPDQAVELLTSSAEPALLFSRRFRHLFRFLGLDVVYPAMLDKDGEWAALVPDSRR